MHVEILNNAQEIGEYAADRILRGVASGKITALGVATGSSPLSIYESLESKWIPQLADLRVFALDEYVGLPPEHPASYHAVIKREVTGRLKLKPANVWVPQGNGPDLTAACARFEAAIAAAGGVDLQILGIGANGHIGFNEPTSSFSSRTRVKTLTPATQADNSRFFEKDEQVPTRCITQGLGTIMESKEVLLVAHGASKAKAIALAVEGPVSGMCPASVLQFHARTTIVIDREAARNLTLLDYYDSINAG